MRNKGKVLVLMLSAAALVAASVFGTMAYLTDEEAVTNTFTVGQVDISLDETDVDENGVKDGESRVQENTYKLIPGQEYLKDPIVHFEVKSEASYLFVKIENQIFDIEATSDADYTNIAGQITANGWKELVGIENVYWQKVDANTSDKAIDYKVFEKFKIDGATVYGGEGTDVAGEKYYLANYADAKIIVTAYAIQAAGFDSESAAWAAGNFN